MFGAQGKAVPASSKSHDDSRSDVIKAMAYGWLGHCRNYIIHMTDRSFINDLHRYTSLERYTDEFNKSVEKLVSRYQLTLNEIPLLQAQIRRITNSYYTGVDSALISQVSDASSEH